MGKPITDKSVQRYFQHPCQDLIRFWALRILLDLGGSQEIGQRKSLWVPVLHTFGLDAAMILQDETTEIHDLLIAIDRKREENPPALEGVLKKNLNSLGKALELNGTDKLILAFFASMKIDIGMEQIVRSLGELPKENAANVLSFVLDLPSGEIGRALSRKASLIDSGLVRISDEAKCPLERRFRLSFGLSGRLFQPQSDIFGMLEERFRPASEGHLAAEDYSHLREDYHLLSRYLKSAIRGRLKGVNVLIHGRPGTGKSELARTLAEELDCQLFEIGMMDSDGDPYSGIGRLFAFRLAQRILARKKGALILFDEIEDIFEKHPEFPTRQRMGPSAVRTKAWMNDLLEQNPVPAVWISNRIGMMETALLRRFRIVLELDHPPRKARARILEKRLRHLPVSGEWISRAADNTDIAPALIDNAARVVDLVSNGDSSSTEADLERLLGNSLKSMGYSGKLMQRRENALPYCLDVLNPDRDLTGLLEGMQANPTGRLCLYGPPGTGKTEFARHVSRCLSRPLLLKRASDLLHPFLGITERLISRMFDEARDDDAVLLLDEADSFLRDRRGAQRSWEVTQVNELLTQMEDFQGLFICATNLLDELDEASLRRFDLKIKFGFLQPDQAWILFRQTLIQHGSALKAAKKWRTQLAQVDNLTPGDFATVVRQNRLTREPITPETLLRELAGESSLKRGGASRGIGFTASLSQ